MFINYTSGSQIFMTAEPLRNIFFFFRGTPTFITPN
jgi:hypothetical protein